MQLKFLAIAMLLAGMGPARNEPAPDAPTREQSRPMSPEEVPGAVTPAPQAQALREIAATDAEPREFLWTLRPVVVFADTPDDPAFARQMQALRARPEALAERDVIIVTDTDPAANSVWRRQFHPRGFSLVILDKDGQVKQRRPAPWDVREITRAIDKFPLRRQEIGRAGVLP